MTLCGLKVVKAVAIHFNGWPGMRADEGVEIGFELFLFEYVWWAVEELTNTAQSKRIDINRALGFALAF